MSYVARHMLHVRNALHSVQISSKYISHVNLSHVTCYMSPCHMLHVTMSHVTCHKLYVLYCTSYVIYCILEMPCILFWFQPNISHMSTCHMLHVIWRISHVTCHTWHVLGNAMDACMLFWVHSTCVTFQSVICDICDMWHVTCHMSFVTCHMSQVMCQMSHVVFHMSLDMSCIVQSPWCWPNKMTI